MYALVYGSRVCQLAAEAFEVAPPLEWIECDDSVTEQHSYADGNFIAPTPPVITAPVPATISDRQFFQQLAVDGIITRAEALAAVKTGEIPAALAGIIDALPDDQKFAAEMLLSGATTFERAHPLSVAIGEARGMTAEEVDDFFRAAAAL